MNWIQILKPYSATKCFHEIVSSDWIRDKWFVKRLSQIINWWAFACIVHVSKQHVMITELLTCSKQTNMSSSNHFFILGWLNYRIDIDFQCPSILHGMSVLCDIINDLIQNQRRASYIVDHNLSIGNATHRFASKKSMESTDKSWSFKGLFVNIKNVFLI